MRRHDLLGRKGTHERGVAGVTFRSCRDGGLNEQPSMHYHSRRISQRGGSAGMIERSENKDAEG